MGREENKRGKLARIREAAAELFTTRGFDETSVAEIAARAGVAKGTVFLYAETKADLLALVFEERLRAVVASALAALDPSRSLSTELGRVFSRFFGVYEPRPALARLILRELSFARGHALRVRDAVDRELLTGLAAHVEARKEQGEVAADVPGALVATNAFGLYLLALFGWLSGALPSRAVAEAHLGRSLELACRGLALPATSAPAHARARESRPRARTTSARAPARRTKGARR